MAAHQLFGNATAQSQPSSNSAQSTNSDANKDTNRFPRTRPLWNFKSPHMYSKLEQAALNVDGFAPDPRTMKSKVDYIVALRDFRILRLNKNLFAYFQRFDANKPDDVVFTDFTPFMANYIHLFELIEKEFRQDLAKEGIIAPDPADKDTSMLDMAKASAGNLFASATGSIPATPARPITNGVKFTPSATSGPTQPLLNGSSAPPSTPSLFGKTAATPVAPSTPALNPAPAASTDTSRTSKRKAEEQGDKDNPFGKRPAWGSDAASKPLASASAQKLNRFISESPNRPKAGVPGATTPVKSQTENAGSTPFKFLKTMKSSSTTPKPATPSFTATQPTATNTGLAKSAFAPATKPVPAASQPSTNIFNFGATSSKPAEQVKPVEPSPQKPTTTQPSSNIFSFGATQSKPVEPSPQKPAATPSFVFGGSGNQPAASAFVFGSSVGQSQPESTAKAPLAAPQSMFNFSAGATVNNPFAASTSEAPNFGLNSSKFSQGPVTKTPSFGGFSTSAPEGQTPFKAQESVSVGSGLGSSAFSKPPAEQSTSSEDASRSFFKPTYTAPTTPLKLFGAPTDAPKTASAFNPTNNPPSASLFGGFKPAETKADAPAISSTPSFGFKPVESKPINASAAPTGFKPTGFKPAGLSGPVNFLGQFGEQASKFEKDLKQRQKDEDFDSEEDNEDEWEKSYETKQAEKKKKFEEQLQSLAPPPKFGPAGGFDLSRSASPAGSVLEGPRPAGPHLFSNLSAVNSPAAEESDEEQEEGNDGEVAEVEEDEDGEEEGDDEDESSADYDDEDDSTEQDDTDAEQPQVRNTPVTRSLFARMAKGDGTPSKPALNGVATSEPKKRKADSTQNERKSPEPTELDRSKKRRGSPEKAINGDASQARSLFDRITPRSPEKQTPKPSANPTFTFTPAAATPPATGGLFNFSKTASTPQTAVDSSPIGAPTPTPKAPGFSFTPLAKPSMTFGAGGSFSFGKPSFGASTTTESKSTDSSQTSAATASFGSTTFAPSFKATPGGFGTSSFKFGAAANKSETPLASQPPSTVASPFVFPTPGGDSATPSRLNTPSGITSAEEKDDANESEDAPSQPQADLVNFDSYLADNDILFETEKAKAFIHVKDPNQRSNKAQAWETKGVGPIVILKPKEEGKGGAFIVMKSHPAGRVLLNSYIKPSIKYELVGPKRVRFLIVDGKGVPESWLVQFGTEEIAKEFALICAKNK